ncbi:MAG: hypothetical protein IPK82_12810 [Polyangiaceae bacterium]|nr:hypothetical protein [Polyangiaceae bacterium]
MIASYRDANYAATLRINKLRELSPRVIRDVPVDVLNVYSKRIGRATAGTFAIGGFCSMVAVAIVYGVLGGEFLPPTLVLAGTLAALPLVYLAAVSSARRRFAERIAEKSARATDALSLAARLEPGGILDLAHEMAQKEERRSIALPLVGASLLGPLSMHMLVYIPILGLPRVSNLGEVVKGFDVWICLSLVLVGIAHGVLAWKSYRFADRLSQLPLVILSEKIPTSPWSVFGWVWLASIFPGAIALFIPPILTAITGAVLIPLMFNWAYKRVLQERNQLEP